MNFPATRIAIRSIAPGAVLGIGLLFSATSSSARPDYTRRTKQECAYCHPPGGWYLTDAGKYFRDHRSLNGYHPQPEQPKSPSDKPTTKETEKPKQKQSHS